MKNKILIYLSGIIAILALCFGAFYYNFFGGSDPRMKEAGGFRKKCLLIPQENQKNGISI